MGVYDFFKGSCPNCGRGVDHHPDFGRCGDIQTKFFIEGDLECFREFRPGSRVPFPPGCNLIIGRTSCCKTIIKAEFHDDLLAGYHVVGGRERYEYIKNELRSFYERQYMPEHDLHYYEHRSRWQDLKMEEAIVRAAFHPAKITHYLEMGYTLKDVCDM